MPASTVGRYSEKPEEFKPGMYRHYKGATYRALFLVYHHDTEETFVVYISMAYPQKIRLREYASEGKDSWTDFVSVPKGEVCGPNPVLSCADGDVFKRFEYLSP